MAEAQKTIEQRLSAIERLLFFLRLPTVARPEAVHGFRCRYPREGKRHGPCTCGARELDANIRQTLIDCKVSVGECPDEVSERLGLVRRA